VIVLDINMPGGTGVDALRKLKRSVRTATIPVIVVSGSEDAAMPAMVLELGASEFLAKPVDRDALLAAMERAGQG
jgi:FixJ family two-component response regulator